MVTTLRTKLEPDEMWACQNIRAGWQDDFVAFSQWVAGASLRRHVRVICRVIEPCPSLCATPCFQVYSDARSAHAVANNYAEWVCGHVAEID